MKDHSILVRAPMGGAIHLQDANIRDLLRLCWLHGSRCIVIKYLNLLSSHLNIGRSHRSNHITDRIQVCSQHIDIRFKEWNFRMCGDYQRTLVAASDELEDCNSLSMLRLHFRNRNALKSSTDLRHALIRKLENYCRRLLKGRPGINHILHGLVKIVHNENCHHKEIRLPIVTTTAFCSLFAPMLDVQQQERNDDCSDRAYCLNPRRSIHTTVVELCKQDANSAKRDKYRVSNQEPIHTTSQFLTHPSMGMSSEQKRAVLRGTDIFDPEQVFDSVATCLGPGPTPNWISAPDPLPDSETTVSPPAIGSGLSFARM